MTTDTPKPPRTLVDALFDAIHDATPLFYPSGDYTDEQRILQEYAVAGGNLTRLFRAGGYDVDDIRDHRDFETAMTDLSERLQATDTKTIPPHRTEKTP